MKLAVSILSIIALSSSISPGEAQADVQNAPQATLSPKVSQDQVRRWLSAHQGLRRFKLYAQSGLSGATWIEITHDDQGVHLWYGSHGRQSRGRPLDHYHVVHKVFKSEPPFQMTSADLYQLDQGEARALSWRLRGDHGAWVAADHVKELRRQDRKDEKEGAALAAALWSSGISAQQFDSRETLVSHMGLSVQPELEQRSVHLLQLSNARDSNERPAPVDMIHTLRRVDRHVRRGQHGWELRDEVKVTDERGRVSYQIQDNLGRTIYTHISDQLYLISDEHRYDPPYRFSAQLRYSEKLRADGRAAWARHLRAQLDPCREHLSTEMDGQALKLRFLTHRGALKWLSFKHSKQWSAYMICLAERLERAPKTLKRSSLEGKDLTFSIELSR